MTQIAKLLNYATKNRRRKKNTIFYQTMLQNRENPFWVLAREA
jgi:hypothetical protein